MPLNLPTVGTVSYGTPGNVYTCGPACFTKSIVGTPVMDRAGRTVSHVLWKIVVEDVVATSPPATVDNALDRLRGIFSRNGGQFRYDEKGFGDFAINTANVKDVMFGPKVKLTILKQQLYFAKIQLEFEVALLPCVEAVPKGLMAATFKVDFDINEHGFTKRTFSGTILVAMTTQGRRLLDNADNYREKFIPDVPKGFRRTNPGRYSLNEAKNELSITVVDEEHRTENYYPPGCTYAKLSYSTGNAGSMVFTRQDGVLRGTYTLAKGVDYGLALLHFKRACDKFFLKPMAKGVGRDAVGRLKNQPGVVGTVLPISTSINWPDLYNDPTMEIECRMAYLTSPTLFFVGFDNVKLDNASEDVWKKSMSLAHSPRGYAGLGLNNGDDLIVDLCDRFQGGVLKNKKGGMPVPVRNPAAKALLGATWPMPAPANSWIDIQTSYQLQTKDRVLRHIPLESGEARLRTPALVQGEDAFARMVALVRGSDPPTFQVSAASPLDLLFSGFAVRAGYPIPCPTIRSFAGRATIPMNGEGHGFQLVELPFTGPVPLYFARWHLRFGLSDKPFQIEGGWEANPQRQQAPVAPVVPLMNFGQNPLGGLQGNGAPHKNPAADIFAGVNVRGFV